MMSLPRPSAADPKHNPPTLRQSFLDSGPAASCSWPLRNGSCAQRHPESKAEESDEELFTVPDMNNSNNTNPEASADAGLSQKRRGGRNAADKEHRRLKRLLRNRVSAQEARERRKIYVRDLEARAGELQDCNSRLEERISTLINENTMLRKILLNTRPKLDGSEDHVQ